MRALWNERVISKRWPESKCDLSSRPARVSHVWKETVNWGKSWQKPKSLNFIRIISKLITIITDICFQILTLSGATHKILSVHYLCNLCFCMFYDSCISCIYRFNSRFFFQWGSSSLGFALHRSAVPCEATDLISSV